jgi:hypothetical protein
MFLLASALAGCESTTGDDGAPPEPAGDVKLKDANNYTSTSTLAPGEIVTASATDLHIDWSALTMDMQCHEMDPMTDIGKVALIRFRNLTKEEAAALLTAGELEMADIDGYIQYETKGLVTECELSDLSNLGTPVNIEDEYVAAEDKTYMLLWGTGERPGTGARTMTFLKPVVGEVNTDVIAAPGCAPDPDNPGEMKSILEFSATLKTPIEVPAGKTTVDWRAITKDGLGNPLAFNNIDHVLLGFYADKTPEELQEQILDIELIATDLWETQHPGGFTTNLRSARHREADGKPGDFFPGFAGYPTGTWLLALTCSFCQNPAPLILAVLEPAE